METEIHMKEFLDMFLLGLNSFLGLILTPCPPLCVSFSPSSSSELLGEGLELWRLRLGPVRRTEPQPDLIHHYLPSLFGDTDVLTLSLRELLTYGILVPDSSYWCWSGLRSWSQDGVFYDETVILLASYICTRPGQNIYFKWFQIL